MPAVFLTRHLVLVTFALSLLIPAATVQGKGSEFWEARGKGCVIYSVPTARKWIALTFDDGPSPRYTPQILHVLAEHHARATFFVIGEEAKKFPWLVAETFRQGHEIGNHTQSHPKLRSVTEGEITDCDRELQSINGSTPSYWRPPGGNLSEYFLTLARRTHHTIVMWTWDVDSRDWAKPGVEKIVQTVVSHTDPGDIILFHDGGGRRGQTVEALRIILTVLEKKGYSFVTVSQLVHAKT